MKVYKKYMILYYDILLFLGVNYREDEESPLKKYDVIKMRDEERKSGKKNLKKEMDNSSFL